MSSPNPPKRRRVGPSCDDAASQVPRPRTHAFTGCAKCRDRHVKCDLGVPSCLNCSRLKLTCEGYSRKYQWIPSKFSFSGQGISISRSTNEIEDIHASRRVLFTDDERSAMSLWMREECCGNNGGLDLDRVLRELQERASDVDDFLRIGPFGILSVSKAADVPELKISPEQLQTGDESPAEANGAAITTLVLSPSHIDWDGLAKENSQIWERILASTHEFAISEQCASTEDFTSNIQSSWDQTTTNKALEGVYYATDGADIFVCEPFADLLHDMSMSHVDQQYPSPQAHSLEHHSRKLSISTMSNDANLSKIPTEARLLLDYYSENTIAVMSMSSTGKPPWLTIHLPCAMSAFADLVVHGEIRSVARKSLFYALLAISSFHVSLANNNGNSAYWRERGEVHKRKSEGYLHLALYDTMSKPVRGKYKEVLMSGLSMVTIGVFSGNMQEAHTHLAASEQLIRSEGLTKPIKSQKISKLHHIFSFLRIIHESTSLRGRKSSNALELSQSKSHDSQETSETSGSRLAWVEEDDPDDLEEDSLFVSIYQMPTTLLSLLSQTSSLCKQLQSPEGSTIAFARRCKIIEDRLFNWKAPEILALPTYENTSEPKTQEAIGREIAAHLVKATYNALIVHFQRQIRDTNPRVLQHYVRTAADHLLIHEQLKTQISTSPFLWPGFIVGCEAYDLASRQKIDIYLKMIRRYNVGSSVMAEKVVYEVWKRQDSGRADSHWKDVLLDWDMQVVLT